MKEALVVFAKAPLVGEVKTRLIGQFSPEEATELYVCFLQDTFAMMEEVQAEREQVSLVLCYTPADEIEAFESADLEGCLFLAQHGQDLGERLHNCFTDLLAAGFHSIVILGADTPTLPEEFIIEAFHRLAASQEVIIGPATDGGYYLIGSNNSCPQLFVDIDWGTDAVLVQTQARADKSETTLSLLPPWEDVDTPEALGKLQSQIAAGLVAPPRTSKYLKRLTAKH